MTIIYLSLTVRQRSYSTFCTLLAETLFPIMSVVYSNQLERLKPATFLVFSWYDLVCLLLHINT